MKFSEQNYRLGETIILTFVALCGWFFVIGGVVLEVVSAIILFMPMTLLITIKVIDGFFLSFSHVIIDETGIRKIVGKRRSQFIAWADIYALELSGRTSHHRSTVVASDIIVVTTKARLLRWWQLLFRGFFVTNELIFFGYSEEVLQEIRKYYKKEIKGPKPYYVEDSNHYDRR